ncbi:N-acyl-D-amino-acid deacylase family protein [Pseudoalteromonas sp. T1lg65]|uniref:N-acyl-D-amino-acid deacylase family protein n=1 Tax=Pseudoalteromonas sp. T1lg65 TaxID=2077101 RepID=UPI003F7918F1
MHGALNADCIIRNITIYDGQLSEPFIGDIAIAGAHIVAMGKNISYLSDQVIEGSGLALAPGFIDVHTHDDLEVFRDSAMLSKLSQGVTSVIAGNCGISAVPFDAKVELVDPINLLGSKEQFSYRKLQDYREAFASAKPSVNLAMLVGHTSLRAQVMVALDRSASDTEIQQMQALLIEAMQQGALGLSTGLAYKNANAASFEEVCALIACLPEYNGVYTTHLRTEFDAIIDAMDEAFQAAKSADVPLVISHLKCAGKHNWGRAKEVLNHLKQQAKKQQVGCDCYPYAASSSTLDLKQVTSDTEIFITWSDSYPEMAKRSLAEIAQLWQLSLYDAAKKLQPAGAVYHCMDEQDVKEIVSSPLSMIGSDGLPCDPHPHPRLWGTFPRVIGHYCMTLNALSLPLAIHKMTALPAAQFGLHKRGVIKVGNYADLVMFDPLTIIDRASYDNPKQQAQGISKVWVNGRLSFCAGDDATAVNHRGRAGQFLSRFNNKKQGNQDDN